jgi:hypothetical protein
MCEINKKFKINKDDVPSYEVFAVKLVESIAERYNKKIESVDWKTEYMRRIWVVMEDIEKKRIETYLIRTWDIVEKRKYIYCDYTFYSRVGLDEMVMCVRCACNMTAEERNRDYSIGKGAYVCDKCLHDEEEYCFQQHLLVSGIKCRKCDVYLEPHTQDEHLDINHKVHKCEGGHKR